MSWVRWEKVVGLQTEFPVNGLRLIRLIAELMSDGGKEVTLVLDEFLQVPKEVVVGVDLELSSSVLRQIQVNHFPYVIFIYFVFLDVHLR